MDIPDLTAAEYDLLDDIYKDAIAKLSKLLKSTAFQQAKSAAILKQLQYILDELNFESSKWISAKTQKQILAADKTATKNIKQICRRIGQNITGVKFGRVDNRAVKIFARQMAKDMHVKTLEFGKSAKRVISLTQQKLLANPEIHKHLAKGLIAGGSINNISRGLRGRLTAAGKQLLANGDLSAAQLKQIADLQAGYITAGKRTMKLNQYCRLVASYQLREAAVESTKQRLSSAGKQLGDENLFDLVEVVGPYSGDFCDFYVGKVFSISGNSDKYPPTADMPNGGPPFHPNCRHTLAPFVEKLASETDIVRAQINPQFLGIDAKQAQKKFKGPYKMLAAKRAAGTRVAKPENH